MEHERIDDDLEAHIETDLLPRADYPRHYRTIAVATFGIRNSFRRAIAQTPNTPKFEPVITLLQSGVDVLDKLGHECGRAAGRFERGYEELQGEVRELETRLAKAVTCQFPTPTRDETVETYRLTAPAPTVGVVETSFPIPVESPRPTRQTRRPAVREPVLPRIVPAAAPPETSGLLTIWLVVAAGVIGFSAGFLLARL